jgi:hypothetical protein
MRDVVAFQQQCQRYLTRKRVPPDAVEDLVSEMVLYALEHPMTVLSVPWVYLHACDRLDPRQRVYGERLRESQRLCSLDASRTPAGEDPYTVLDRLPAEAGLWATPQGDRGQDVAAELLALWEDPERLLAGTWDLTLGVTWLTL